MSNWIAFRRSVRSVIREHDPSVIVTMMLHSLAAVPKRIEKSSLLVSCIYDIPADNGAGRLDRIVNARGWKRLADADLVWASDLLKAELAQQFGHLQKPPLVCHNCPPIDYLPKPSTIRDSRLRNRLRNAGASLRETGGCIILRAGAVGENGGIEETLEALRGLPEDYVFLMMGRPPSGFRERIVRSIAAEGLQTRAFLWERPSDSVWKLALQGSDVGHLIHTPPKGGGYFSRLYEMNSSLSNTRLYQYMAAGLPILAYDDPRMHCLYSEVDCFRVARIKSMTADLREIIQELGSVSSLREKLGACAREAHVLKYNWEKQFAPVLQQINVGINRR